nr:DUF3159 domain-containing protein [Micromonospora sp. DSM 115978]
MIWSPDHRRAALPTIPTAGSERPQPITLNEAIGGPRGIIDSAIPTVAFVMVNAEAGLTAGIVVAIASAIALVILRLVRREPVQQAFSGLFAVGVAAFVAWRPDPTLPRPATAPTWWTEKWWTGKWWTRKWPTAE